MQFGNNLLTLGVLCNIENEPISTKLHGGAI